MGEGGKKTYSALHLGPEKWAWMEEGPPTPFSVLCGCHCPTPEVAACQ